MYLTLLFKIAVIALLGKFCRMATLFRADGDIRHTDSSRHSPIQIVAIVPYPRTHLHLLHNHNIANQDSNMCSSNYYIPAAQAISILGCALLSGTPIPFNPLNPYPSNKQQEPSSPCPSSQSQPSPSHPDHPPPPQHPSTLPPSLHLPT